MSETRISANLIVESQLPNFVKEEFPLVSEFLSQYYQSLEYQSGVSDILQNIDQYVKVDQLANLTDSTTLTQSVGFLDDIINVSSTYGFPDHYGLILIDSEIITYTEKTSTTFVGCVRGFSGVTSYQNQSNTDELVFSTSEIAEHSDGSKVANLSVLFLKEFFNKVKKQVTPGFESRELYSTLNDGLFVKQAKDFYSSKGTDNSFKILFGALYGKNVEVIKPRDYLFQPSDAQYRVTRDLVVEVIEGDPSLLENKTLYQDADENFEKAEGTISKVEKIVRGTKEYYVISLDYDYDRDISVSGTVLGSFSIHPKTILITSVEIGATTLDVDSTVGFPLSGILSIPLDNGTSLTVSYTSKTVNQFLGCSGISQSIPFSNEIFLDSYAYGYSDNLAQEIVKVRILGVLSDINVSDQNPYYDQGDFIFIKSLGSNLTDYKSNNWFFNAATRFDVESISLLDSSDYTYRVNLYDTHNFSIGDNIVLISSSGQQFLTNVVSENITFLDTSSLISFQNRKSFNIQGQGQINTNLFYSVQKVLSKVNSSNFTYLNQYTSNVQNVYDDLNGSIYVASPSLPTYLTQQLNIIDRSVTFSGSFSGTLLTIGSHKFYTGDSIVYNSTDDNNRLDLPNGIYFVNKINDNTIQLARSKENIFTGNFIEVNGTVINNKFQLTNFTYSSLEEKLVETQKLIRKISEPENDSLTYQTEPGATGIFVNGVEILNYKSDDEIYFGEIENISVTAAGSGYDVVNPPTLTISDDVGSGASAYCSVLGSLERVDIIDPGFDYLEDPIITISGGNGNGALIKPNLTDFDHFAEFNSASSSGLVDLSNNTIGFSSHHKFRDAEKVIYNTQSQTNVGGLTTTAFYYVSVQDAFTVKLHKTFNDAAVGINTIDLTSYGVGNHRFLSVNKKKKLTSIVVVDGGSNYQNKKVTTTTSGINTATDSIFAKDHGYQSGEIVKYTPNGTAIGGLSTSSYYVTKISNDEFKLSAIGGGTVGVGTEVSSFYYDTKQYINLTSTGSGTHEFNYPSIEISIKGNIGVSTLSGQNYNAVLQPIIRGSIQSVYLESGGTSYGSEDILNYNRQPQFTLQSGSGAQLLPIISNGRIAEVLVKNSGSGYNSVPNLIISGSGSGAILTPIVVGGILIEVKVISGGIGYSSSDTVIVVENAGSEAKFEASIKSWRVNIVERLIAENQIPLDDGIIEDSINTEYGLQYYHAYAPRSLRKSVLASKFIDGETRFVPDLQIFAGKEVTSDSHSPIIGWAYDGNPIYGPYGYASPTGGTIKCLNTGYELTTKTGRPNISTYPLGFFVEDYEFTGSGDLDEHNGRFTVTPEYPNGIYAYFCTINSISLDSVGIFENYRRPVFPYIIGNEYKSKPNSFNFLKSSNQDEIDINATGWLRNTTPYNATKSRSYYDYLINPDNIKRQISVIQNSTRGVLDSVGIITGGQDYQVQDSIVFNNTGTSGAGAIANVSSVKGKSVSQISVASSIISNIEFIPTNNINALLGFTTSPHGLSTNEIVTFSSLYAKKQSATVSVVSNKLNLVAGVGSVGYTGLVTYFNVSGSLSYPSIRENDIYQILDEQVKVLNVDSSSSRIRVLRNQNGTVGVTSYSAGIGLTEVSRKFEINVGLSTSYSFNANKQLYFDPSESVGLGTTSGVGIGYTLIFTNPGAGITQINIPTRSVYIPNHNLITGDELVYSSNGGTAVSVSTDGVSTFTLTENQIVYTANLSSDLIGISTIKVGLGTTGSFVGIGSTFATLLYFTSVGSGNTHSFETNYSNILTGEVNKNLVTVSTSSTHGLKTNDIVDVTVTSGLTTTVVVKYNDYNRRLIFNPRDFISSNINLATDTIALSNHKYVTGQKVIHTSTSSAGGLENERIYYVVVVDSNKIKLSNTFYGATKQNPDIVGITTTSFGTISPINPFIRLTKNNTLVFDVSDSSLSFTQSGTSYSAFDLSFYTDPEYLNEFKSTEKTTLFNVTKSGSIGITSTATVTLRVDDNLRDTLYYKLNPINLSNNIPVKKEIVIDNDVVGHNQIKLVESIYNGKHKIFESSTSSFTYTVFDVPEQSQYTSNNGLIEYTTTSSTSYGSISSISLKSKGKNYKKLPQISAVQTSFGKNAILVANSSSIGSITTSRQIDIQDIGFDYSADLSVRPVAEFPNILKIENLSSFKSIGISSFGRNYLLAPDLVVLDGITNKVISDVDLRYELGNNQVQILQNTKGLSNAIPTILPVNNINGVGISTIRFIPSSKDVVVTLGSSFSNASDFPFEIGDKVLIEGISVGIATTSKGFNSLNYNYALFTIINTDPNIGGIGATVSYNLTSYLGTGEIPGTYDSVNSVGRIIPQKHFPIFDIELQQNKFNIGENVFSQSSSGIVQNWDDINGNLKVATSKTFEENELLIGEASQTQAIIQLVTAKTSDYHVKSSSVVKKGWNRETGFLNNNLQRLHDNDYYQYFSYSLKSQIQLDTWEEPVSSLNHVVGFKKFSDLLIENDVVGIGTTTTNYAGISTSQDNGDFVGIVDFDQEVNLNCVYDFDLASERTVTIGSNVGSNEIVLNSQVLQDYLESVGNRVLMIDDISPTFNSNPRPTPFSVVGTFNINEFRYRKYITCTFDKLFTNLGQLFIDSLRLDGSTGYINQYARVETVRDLGSYDFTISGSTGQLLFYPIYSTLNSYDVSLSSYGISDFAGIGTCNLGTVATVQSTNVVIPSGTTAATTVVGIASTYRASKILVQIGSTVSSYFEVDELTILHDGTDVQLLEYGQLTTDNLTSFASAGIGTYDAYISGSTINVDLTPSSALTDDYTVNTIFVAIGDTSAVGVGTSAFVDSQLSSSYVVISSSPTPTATAVASLDVNLHDSAYYVACVEDTTNNRYQVSEIISIYNGSTYHAEFGNLYSDVSLGDFSTQISGGLFSLTFTPIADIDCEVRVYQHGTGHPHDLSLPVEIDLNNAHILGEFGDYEGTDVDIKKSFNLTHKQLPIFERYITGNDSEIVDLTLNALKIPNHYFVTGEKLIYNYQGDGVGTDNAIGIATTTITGIGLTDKLPSELYAVKVNDLYVRVSASASEALQTIPSVLTLSSVGIGTSHVLRATNQNAKGLISIDNVIQSPIVSTAITTQVASDIEVIDVIITLSGITSFFGGDLIKINNEIMKIDSIGYGATNNLIVERGFMGSGISTHGQNDVVSKVLGNYNIINNTIYFAAAPYGQIPFSNPSNRYDEQDYVGLVTSSTFTGRIFTKSGVPNSINDSYYNNYIIGDISSNFNGDLQTFTLQSNRQNITGISTSNAVVLLNQIFQGPARNSAIDIEGDYSLSEQSGITSITFTGSGISTTYDINTSGVPRGGILVSVGSTGGFGYQPLVSAGGTATVSIAGTISAISIGNSGSGYRSGIQTVNVGVALSSTGVPDVTYIGIATVVDGHVTGVAITNPGVGYTTTNPPIVIFDSPLSYSNLPLIYSSSSTTGVGTAGVIDIVVGQGSSVIGFEIRNSGYSYKVGETLTVETGGLTGIPTNSSLPFNEFQIYVDKTQTDLFSAWTVGDLQVLDPIDTLFDGETKTFPLRIDGLQTTIRARKGSNIDIQATLLVFINDILQVPGNGYIFNGGSTITFPEPPKPGDLSKLIFYKGNGDIDVVTVDILETIKTGDTVQLYDDLISLTENERLVTQINSTDVIQTNLYFNPGLTPDETYLRPLIWCRQTEDKIINGVEVGKDRVWYESLIQPTTNLIQNVGINSNVIFVESVKTFFDHSSEYDSNSTLPKKIIITSQDLLVTGIATAIVSAAGTISSIVISDGGVGYTTAPTVTIGNPVGIGTTTATATATISSGSVSSINVAYPGYGYTTSNPPSVLIESPTPTTEIITNVAYEGDFGIITGIQTTSVGVASTGIVFDLFIPLDSFLRDTYVNSVGIATTGVSGIQTGYYFVVSNSNIGFGVNSINQNGSVVGLGNTFVDNIYEVAAVSIAQTSVPGVGLTYVAQVTVSVEDYNGLTGLGFSNFYGEYSWGRLSGLVRSVPKAFEIYNNGLSGINTSPIVQRITPLKYLNYNT